MLLARMDEMLQKSPLEILMVGVLLLLLPALVAGTPPLKPLNSIIFNNDVEDQPRGGRIGWGSSAGCKARSSLTLLVRNGDATTCKRMTFVLEYTRLNIKIHECDYSISE
jgi:hypothetical protein